AGAFGDLVVALGDRLQGLMIGRNAEADEAVGNRIAVEDIDARLLAIGLFQRLGGVEARRPRSDHREMPHPLLQCCFIVLSGKVVGRQPLWWSSSSRLPFFCSIAWIGVANIPSRPV